MPHGMAKKKERVYKPRVVDGKAIAACRVPTAAMGSR
jgi:hypothetical protein